MMTSERPRRTTRKTAKAENNTEEKGAKSTSAGKRKAIVENEGEYELSDLLQYSKSALTTMDISDLINPHTWELLSPESKTGLVGLLPPTAFKGYKQTIGSEHPACQSPTNASSSSTSNATPENIDPSFFNDLHFLAAARTFRDHLYSGWLTDKHKEKVKKWEEDVRSGKTAAPWKDEEWEKNAGAGDEEKEKAVAGKAKAKEKTMPVSEIRLYELARNSVIREGDVLSYKRHFSHSDLTIEKDVLIHSINTRQRSLTIFLERGSTQQLPFNLLIPDPQLDSTGTTQSIEITSPTMLETAILDFDGRVKKDKRPNGNAWKSFTVWRWREGFEGSGGDRGGRENHGTLFYLRGSFYNDR